MSDVPYTAERTPAYPTLTLTTTMPNLGSLHPYVVHVVIGTLLSGILLRWLSLNTRWTWADRSAAALLILGAMGS